MTRDELIEVGAVALLMLPGNYDVDYPAADLASTVLKAVEPLIRAAIRVAGLEEVMMFVSNIEFDHCCYCQWENCRPGIPTGECRACYRQRIVETIDDHC